MKYLDDVYLTNLNAVYNLGGYFSVDAGGSWELEGGSFDQCKFYFILEGSCTLTLGGKTLVARAGEWLFIPAGAYHSYANDKTARFSKYWVHFNLYPDDSALTELDSYKVGFDFGGRAHLLFSELEKISRSDDLSDKLKIKAILFELVAEFIKAGEPYGVSVRKSRDERLDGVLRYINENLDKPLDNDTLAERYYAHPNHFIRAFRDKVGTTPAKYVAQRRMETARLLLESTDLSAGEIGERIGFRECAHFSRFFKEWCDMSPTTYRKYFKSFSVE